MYKVATGFALTVAFLSIASINISITRWQHDHRVKPTENIVVISKPAQSSVSLASSNPSNTSIISSTSTSSPSSSIVKTATIAYQNKDLGVGSSGPAMSNSANK